MVTELEFKQGVIDGQNLVIAELKKRLDVAEKIMAQLFIEPEDDEIFKEYCKLCSQNEDCEWGDNFPYCLSPSVLERKET